MVVGAGSIASGRCVGGFDDVDEIGRFDGIGGKAIAVALLLTEAVSQYVGEDGGCSTGRMQGERNGMETLQRHLLIHLLRGPGLPVVSLRGLDEL